MVVWCEALKILLENAHGLGRGAPDLTGAAKPRSRETRWRCEKPRSREIAGGAARSREATRMRVACEFLKVFRGFWELAASVVALRTRFGALWRTWRTVARCGALLWRTVAHGGAAWHTAAHCGALQRIVAHCGAVWRCGAHSGAHCFGALLWRTVAHCMISQLRGFSRLLAAAVALGMLEPESTLANQTQRP